MTFSANFWIEFGAILLAFIAVIVAIPWYRKYQINRARAHHLRIEFSDNIKMSLPNIASTLMQTLDEHGRVANDSTALKFCLFQLDALIARYEVLYSDEQTRVSKYRNGLHALIGNFDAGNNLSDATEDLILLGERIVEDLRENGLLSTVTR